MKQNKSFIAEQQTDPVLPGWMSSVLFNFDEPEETTSFIQAVAKLHTAKSGRIALAASASPPEEKITRRN